MGILYLLHFFFIIGVKNLFASRRNCRTKKQENILLDFKWEEWKCLYYNVYKGTFSDFKFLAFEVKGFISPGFCIFFHKVDRIKSPSRDSITLVLKS